MADSAVSSDSGSIADRFIKSPPSGAPLANEGEPAPQDGGLSLAQLRSMLWRQKSLVIVLTAVALIAGLIFTLLATPQYTSQATVVVENESLNVNGDPQFTRGIAAAETQRYLETQRKIIESRNLALVVVDVLGLAGNERFLAIYGLDEMPAALGEGEAETARRMLAAQVLQNNVTMEFEINSRVGTIGFTTADPILASQIVNGYAASYVAENVRAESDTNAYARGLLQRQIAEGQAKLQETERKALVYARNNGLVDADGGIADGGSEAGPAPNTSITTASLSQINSGYVQAQQDRILAEQRWNAARRVDPLSLPQARDSTVIQGLLAQRAAAQGELDQLRQRYVDAAPEVMQAQARLDAVESQLAEAGSKLRESIRQEYLTAREQERQLGAARAQYADDTLEEQGRRVEFNLLNREAQTMRETLAELQRRLGILNRTSDTAANNIRILDQADPAGVMTSPNLLRNMLMSLMLGLFVGGGLAIVREAFDDTLYSPQDAEKKLALPLLGSTPYLADVSSEEMDDMHSDINEAYFAIRSSVDFATGGKQKKSIQVTSCRPAEGKSTTSVALARDFARIGRRTLLIDADFRKPQLHKSLGVSADKGFVDALMNEASIADVTQSLPQTGLDFIPLGTLPPNPAQLLASDVLRDFLEQLQAKYDVVIVDSAPVMGLADAPVLSGLVDHTLLVLEAGRIKTGQARQAVRRLRESGANMAGFVLTKYDQAKAGDEDYYYYYSYSYGNRGQE
ncbi:GumC family protein [Paraurantiacibacter namhicola]|uniref:non-specific protein-tyrosine kinase n=1 Tax=Paraurantiacibacter namhicola TaxID=645517 RepID=A0A1C7D714_9SPHN|nr:polysaccharide biosynthesis tyrosine autokinase [Paraurantiacibacter namhicola]ANU07142.1 Tyrosine-protein kinase YwqD [Paraurantiacibacter namhicola]